jgi:hypothetical protein
VIWRQLILLAFVAATFSGATVAAMKAARGNAIHMLDADGDGLLDIAEVKKAAATLFARLDRDGDGAVDKRELAGRWSTKRRAAADTDHDGRLTEDEYMVAVEQHFNRADFDNDGRLTDGDLKSRAGKMLLRMMR